MKIAQTVAKLAMMAIGVLFASAAMASTWAPETILHDAKSGTNRGYFIAADSGYRYEFTTVPGISTAYYDGNFAQGPSKVANELKLSGEFGLTSTSMIKFIAGNNVAGTGFTLAPTNPLYNLLAVHGGGAEILFAWTPANSTAFNITSSANNLSNYRAYQADGLVIQSSIPEPSTYVMMLVGLLAVGFMVRRRNSDAGIGSGAFAA
jgi:hypothetical protein